MNGTTVAARKHYNAASRSFVVRDYTATAASLDAAYKSLAPSRPRDSLDALLSGRAIAPPVDLKRRLDILRITFLATVHSTPAARSPPSPAPHLTPLLDLAPDQLVKALWASLIDADTPDTAEAAPETGHDEIVPSSRASSVHPSLATALCLAALKLDQPKLARAVAEAWIGSTTDELDRLAWDVLDEIRDDWPTELPIDGVASTGMSGSATLSRGAGKDGAAAAEARRQFVKSWIKLLDLVVLHISPRLDEWDAAGDLVRLQSVENGGWVPDARVEATLERLGEIRQGEIDSAAARVQRQKEIEVHKAAQLREARSSSKPDKGKGRLRDDHSPAFDANSSSNASSPDKKKRSSHRNGNGSNKHAVTTSSPSASSSSSSATSPTSTLPPALPSPSGFAGLRSSISSYLSHSHPSQQTAAVPPSPSNPISTIASYLRHHYSTDPLRLLSMICFLLALTTYLRRRFSIQRGTRPTLTSNRLFSVRNGMALIAGKVGETLRMGTKVTTL
ncbi:hypothetical protein JCM11491_001388 [Sporobolomyces phaffii]